jgi:hypothetical protein
MAIRLAMANTSLASNWHVILFVSILVLLLWPSSGFLFSERIVEHAGKMKGKNQVGLKIIDSEYWQLLKLSCPAQSR